MEGHAKAVARGGEEVKYAMYVLATIAALLIGALFTVSLMTKQWWAAAMVSLSMFITITGTCEGAISMEEENNKTERKRNR